MMIIRKATEAHIPNIIAIDHIAVEEDDRKQHIKKWVLEGNMVIALDDADLIGYAVLEYTFFFQGFIAMLIVKPPNRRKGVGTSLILHLERNCKTSKLFTSTNESNKPMQELMVKMEYQPSGTVYNLDEGDPELFYFKLLKEDDDVPLLELDE
jgi:N-acetylglutamate synthase-like GNAT family acetyltransferase